MWIHGILLAKLVRTWVTGRQSLSPGPKRYLAQASVDTVLDIHVHQPPGDILLFLTGQAEIDKARPLAACFSATGACLCATKCANVPAAGMQTKQSSWVAKKAVSQVCCYSKLSLWVSYIIDSMCSIADGGVVSAGQAVKQLNEAVATLPEGACDDLLVLPIYSALPLEMQVLASLLAAHRRCKRGLLWLTRRR